MGDKLAEPEFWLPSEFITEEDIVMNSSGFSDSRPPHPGFRFGSEFGNHFGSFSSSPALSETESDEDDSVLTELTRLLNLHRANRLILEKKAMAVSGSPQSTLTTQALVGSGRGSMYTNVPPAKLSPGPYGGTEDAWDLIYQAAGQVAKLKMNGGGGPILGRNPGLLSQQRSLISPAPTKSSASPSFYHSHVINGGKVMGQNGPGFEHTCNWRVGKNSSVLAGAGLRFGHGPGFGPGYGCGSGAGIGGGVVNKSERVGTGVFLPRRYDGSSNPTALDSRKKLGCSSALHTSKDLPAMKKSSNNPSVIPEFPSLPQFGSRRITDYDLLMARRAALLTLQRTYPDGAAARNHEVCLPQEWTY